MIIYKNETFTIFYNKSDAIELFIIFHIYPRRKISLIDVFFLKKKIGNQSLKLSKILVFEY